MDERFKNTAEMILRWRNLHHLVPVWTNVYYIPERVNDYNLNYFVAFNTIAQKFEIHSIARGPNAISREVMLDFDELDVRTLYYLWENDLRVHGKNIFRRIEESEERFRRRKKKDFSNWAQSVARETRTAFAPIAWGTDGKVVFPSAGIGKGNAK